MLPVLVRHLIFPLHERLLGRPTVSLLNALENSQSLSPSAMAQLQAARLKTLLELALRHSPWHAERIRAAGMGPPWPDSFSVAELRRLPSMDKGDASRHRERLVWKGVPGKAFPYNTGGSSGEPLRFYFGRARQAADAACRLRARAWWGHRMGDPEVLLWGAPVELARTDFIRVVRDRLFNQLLLNAFDMSRENMDRYLDAMERFQPRCLYGYASSLSVLAAHALDGRRRLRLPALRVVFTTGETLFPHQRQLIGDVFDCPVANEYGCRDGGLIALESPEGQMLVNSDTVILEVLDATGREVAVGEIGEAVVTNLFSEAQPFIRYRTGDMVRQSGETGRGGRGLQVIGEVMGRSTDFIVRADGSLLHALAVIHILRAVEGIGEFKVIQHAIDRFEVLIRPNVGWRHEFAARIVGGMRERVGEEACIEVVLQDEIAAEVSGKHRYVVSHVPLPRELALAQ